MLRLSILLAFLISLFIHLISPSFGQPDCQTKEQYELALSQNHGEIPSIELVAENGGLFIIFINRYTYSWTIAIDHARVINGRVVHLYCTITSGTHIELMLRALLDMQAPHISAP